MINIVCLPLLFILFFANLTYSQSFGSSQSLTPAQQAALSRYQNVDPSTLSPAEMAAAREMLRKSKGSQSAMPRYMKQDTIPYLYSPFGENERFFNDRFLFKKDSTESDSLALLEEEPKDTLLRFENIIFSQSLPSAFYEVQGIVPADYPLKPDDRLELSLWGTVEKQFALSVNNQGNVFVEGIGFVNIGNLKLGEAEKLITKKLQSIYSGIGHGKISVNLRTTMLAPTKVFVMGFVQRPGGYDLPGNANVFLAIYRAGGPDNIGSIRNIIIRRANGDSTKIDLYNFLLKGQRVGEGLLRDGDLVFIPPSEKLVKATGAIGRPAIYELRDKENLSDLLSFSGGLLPDVDHTVTLWRRNEQGVSQALEPGMAKELANGKTEFQMLNGDSIFVFTSTKPNENTIQVSGSVFYPDYYAWTKGMGVKEAVALAGGYSSEAYLQRIIVERLNADSSFSYLNDDSEGSRGLKILPNDNVLILDSRVLKNWLNVEVTGYVKEVRTFEWQENLNPYDLIALCGGFMPNAKKNEIIIERLVTGKQETELIRLPVKEDLSVKSNKHFALKPGDRIIVEVEDSFYEQELITLSGAFRNTGTYSLAYRGETFRDFMKRIAKLDSNAYIQGGQLYRRSLKVEDSEVVMTDNSFRINLDFKRIMRGKDKDIKLQSGDSIYVPFEMLTVNVTGEVTSPGHILWRKGWDVDDYVNASGGLTINGDEKRIILTYANGLRTLSNKAKDDPDPGSTINVAYKPLPEPTKLSEIVTIIGSIVTVISNIVLLAITINK